ncbi:MAG: holo-ACP synthase, partial [Planctomycetes bacterium]|nr:holo-ACP synthase [Planctomycetota bacterium]
MGEVKGLGTDIVEVERVRRAIERQGQRFLDRVFTEAEVAYCRQSRHPWPHFAVRFAAKEAVLKVFGTGWGQGLGFRDIEVLRDADGRPSIRLHGAAADLARSRGFDDLIVSLSHTRQL